MPEKKEKSKKQKKTQSKRLNGEGSICQRGDGLWLASVTVGRDENGKPIRKVAYAKSSQEATEKKQELLDKYKGGVIYIDADKVTVAQWMDKYLETYAAPSVRINTLAGYKNAVKNHIKPKLGPIRLQKLRPLDIQNMVNQIIAGGGSPRLARAAYDVLRIAINKAIENEILIKSPYRGVKLPKIEPTKHTPLTEEEWTHLFKAAKPSPTMYAAVALLWATGITRSEILGLTWDDVDKKQLTVTIAKAVIYGASGPPVIGGPKAAARRRTLKITPAVLAALESQRTTTKEMRLAAGDAWQKNNLVFPDKNGRLIDPREFGDMFKKVAKAAGLSITLHKLRHDLATHGDISIKDAQYQMGHSTSRMLLDTYTHRQRDSQQKIAALHGTLPGPK